MKIINHIELRDGQAVIHGHGHLKAKLVARKHLWEGLSVAEVMEHYGLTAAEVYAAITYYCDNREELDAEYERVLAEVGDQALTLEQFKAKIAARRLGDKSSPGDDISASEA